MTQYSPVVKVTDGKQQRRSINKCVLLLPVCLLLLLLPLTLLVTGSSPFSNTLFSSSPSISRMASSVADTTAALQAGLGAFTIDLHQTLSKIAPESNLFYSPLSIMTALGMTLMGTRANTREQLAKVLNTQQYSNDELKEAFAAIIAKYKKSMSDGSELRLSNRMYASHLLPMVPGFAQDLDTHFRAVAKTVNFGDNTDAVRQEINLAVEKETNNKIKDLIPAGMLNGMTRLVLVNAVYFKGLWEVQFIPSDTMDKPFYVTNERTVQVPMMRLETKLKLMSRRDLGARVLSLKYKNSTISMVIILPDAKDGLSSVEKKLSRVDLSELCTTGQVTKVELQLPRFKMEYSQDLVQTLKQLGATDLVTAGASDLSGIGGRPGDLFVSNVIHKAFIEVNEEGTEAAAATAVIAMARSLVRITPPFIADHPFMFIVYDEEAKIPLFSGRYMQPATPQTKEEL